MEKGKFRVDEDGVFYTYCPACECYHGYNVLNSKTPHWTFNGDYDNPTLMPSSLLRQEYNGKSNKRPYICHCWIKDGKFEYLTDSTHNYAGQTIDMINEEEVY